MTDISPMCVEKRQNESEDKGIKDHSKKSKIGKPAANETSIGGHFGTVKEKITNQERRCRVIGRIDKAE